MNKAQLEQRFKEFCKGLTPKDRVGIIHHSDADGFSSALIAGKAIERLSGKKPVFAQHYEYGNTKQGRSAVKSMKKERANKLVIVDIGIDSTPQGVGEFCPFEQCLVIDHHRMVKEINSEKIVFLKAEFFSGKEPSSYVAAKFAFDLFGRVTDVSDLDWLACIGIIGDMSLGKWQDFVKKTIEKRDASIQWLNSFVELIAAVEVLAESRMNELFWLFYNAKKPERILESDFSKYLKEFREERDSLIRAFEEKAEHFPEIGLWLYSMKAKHENIKSYVINYLSEMYPGETLIVLQYMGNGRIRFSARRQDGKVKVNELLVQAVKGIPESTAGGHGPAAAGSIGKQFESQFRKKVMEILRKKYGK
ncbi:MAG: DHH family phosphoesterase [Candidatus Diapherotrites archaeon]|uniref:DHH family phosphoesterase n=1 Tax=Candidatus Iainarchaeum sp. TaxID=3101447 RepID=A0A939C9V0_9ARCH|nr:DHH family phosphoesterase [Candidatus Diapherotrites archaeon]